MLTCIARSKRAGEDSPNQADDGDSRNHSVKSLTSQLKDMALKASGAYKNCAPACTVAPGQDQFRNPAGSDPELNRFKRTHSSNSSSTPRVWGKEMEARLKGISSGDATPKSSSGRERLEAIVFVEEMEPKEWVAQVEPGVLITFLSLPRGGNDLRRIRFSRDMFSKLQAQRWWSENFEKIMELYNVQRLNRQACPLPTPHISEDGKLDPECSENRPATPPLTRESFPRNLQRPMGMSYSSSDSLDYQSTQARNYYNSSGINSTPKLSSISGTKMETSSMDTSIRSSSSREADRSEDMSISNASDLENEWVEQDEPGVYITIRALPGGRRELRRVRFSRERFGEMHARVWWEDNRARIHEQYL